jgi:hypothetical protein
MNKVTLGIAIREAERFLASAKYTDEQTTKDHMLFYGSKITASTKRASLDLTRALAQLRKSG